MKMQPYIFGLIVFIFTCQISAQDSNENLCDQFSISTAFGLTQFHGDIIKTKNVKPAFSVQLNKTIDDKHKLQAEFIMGRMAGENSFSALCNNPYHTINGVQVVHQTKGERFDAEFMEFDINLLINISSLFDKTYVTISEVRGVFGGSGDKSRTLAKNRKLNFLAKIGIGINIFRSLRKELETEKFINSYGYQWMWENDFKDAGTTHKAWNKNIKERTFVLGIIAKYKNSKKQDVLFSVANRIGGNDKWDSKLSNKNDMFTFYSLGTTFNLSKN